MIVNVGNCKVDLHEVEAISAVTGPYYEEKGLFRKKVHHSWYYTVYMKSGKEIEPHCFQEESLGKFKTYHENLLTTWETLKGEKND